MRKLAHVAFAFAGAVFLCNYLLPLTQWLRAGLLLALLCVGLCVVRRLAGHGGAGRARDMLLRAALIAGGAAVGVLWTLCWWKLFFLPVYETDNQTLRLHATVSDFPQETAYGYSVLVRPEFAPGTTALLYLDGQGADLRPGDRIETVARMTVADRTFSGKEITFYTAKGIFLRGKAYGLLQYERPARAPLRCWPALFANALKESLDEILPHDAAPLAKAIVTGKRDALSDSYEAAMRRTGLSHVVSVSGMHLAVLAGFLSGFLGRGRRRTALVILPVMVFFAMMAGNTPSVVRAAVMVGLCQIAPLLSREHDSITALGVALLLLLVQNPMACAHVGLQLSFTAVAGIMLVSGRVQDKLMTLLAPDRKRKDTRARVRRGFARTVSSGLGVTLGAMVFTTPLAALYFGQVSVVGTFANLLAVGAVSAIFALALLAGVAGMLAPAVGTLLGLPVVLLVRYLNVLVPLLAGVPFAAIPLTSAYYRMWLIGLYLLIASAALMRKKVRLTPIIGAAALTFIAATGLYIADYRSGDMTVSILDVGQGQSVLVRMEERFILVDCGGEDGVSAGNAAADALQSVGRGALDMLILTHGHADHANGVEQLLSRIRVGLLVLPDSDLDSDLCRTILRLAEEKGIEVLKLGGDLNAQLTQRSSVTVYPPLGSANVNERGLTVLCSVDELDLLITGDMEQEGEALLLDYAHLPEVEVFVVGHHGSASSTTQALLDAVKPAFGVISVGADNRYGHPHADTLSRLGGTEVAVYRTDLMGTVTVRFRAE